MSSIKFQPPSNTGLLIPPWFTERWELIGILVIGVFEKLGNLIMAILDRFMSRKFDQVPWTLTDRAAGKRTTQLGCAVGFASVCDQVIAKLGEVAYNVQLVLK